MRLRNLFWPQKVTFGHNAVFVLFWGYTRAIFVKSSKEGLKFWTKQDQFWISLWMPFSHYLAVKSSITGKKGRNTRRRAWRGSPISGRGFKSILEEEE